MKQYIKNYIKHHNIGEQVKCKICNNKFFPKSKTNIYCSSKCKKMSDLLRRRRGSLKEKKCSYCEKMFKPYQSLQKYCSYECYVNNIKSKRKFNYSEKTVNNIKGKKNPAYRNGLRINGKQTPSKHLRATAKYRKHFLEKNDYLFCENCGTSNSLKFETHHIVFASEAPNHKELHNFKNLIMTCIQCHNDFHGKKREMRKKLVIERGLEEIFKRQLYDRD